MVSPETWPGFPIPALLTVKLDKITKIRNQTDTQRQFWKNKIKKSIRVEMISCNSKSVLVVVRNEHHSRQCLPTYHI